MTANPPAAAGSAVALTTGHTLDSLKDSDPGALVAAIMLASDPGYVPS